jgi:hypothetical protein
LRRRRRRGGGTMMITVLEGAALENEDVGKGATRVS